MLNRKRGVAKRDPLFYNTFIFLNIVLMFIYQFRRMKERLQQPTTWWKIGGLVITLVAMYYNINYRITALEEFKKQVDIVSIKTTLVQIQSDIEWIKNDLKNK